MKIIVSEIISAKKHSREFRFGVRKYATALSRTKKNVSYLVGKIRVRNTRRYKYVCTCPDAFFRQVNCDHIKAFIEKEK